MSLHARCLEDCIRLSYKMLGKIDSSKHRHFSYVYDADDELIGFGTNKPSPNNHIYPRNSLHSEYVALRKARWPRNYWMLNVRIRADGAIGLAHPCNICENILRFTKCKYIVYTLNNTMDYAIRNLNTPEQYKLLAFNKG